ncbi:hypothetical protein DT076_16760 [Desertihabitans brevis]|uniref:Uncharacterized protein n=1 Tax=Desertihabitans brevis TaxID=2268447 RepID=A0A367YR47_9ACTN|nr:hypothetical protein [Desertihabitans brevis]RCK68298.1 hypothetical protein DT076_16760 [Desertihabitans brevis]
MPEPSTVLGAHDNRRHGHIAVSQPRPDAPILAFTSTHEGLLSVCFGHVPGRLGLGQADSGVHLDPDAARALAAELTWWADQATKPAHDPLEQDDLLSVLPEVDHA